MRRDFANEGGFTCFLHNLGGALNLNSPKGHGLPNPCAALGQILGIHE